MGLAAVRERVESMGGRIAVTSTQDRGTKFELRLPLSPVQKEGHLSSREGPRSRHIANA